MQTKKRGSSVYVNSHWTDQGQTISGVSTSKTQMLHIYFLFLTIYLTKEKKEMSVWKWNASRDSLTLLHLGGVTLLSTESKGERIWLGQKVSR